MCDQTSSQFEKFQEQFNIRVRRISQDFVICRICEKYFPINRLSAHVDQCQAQHRKEYYEDQLLAKGALLQQELNQNQNEDMRILFTLLFKRFGDIHLELLINERVDFLKKIITQYSSNETTIIQEIVSILESYFKVLQSEKDMTNGYESDNNVPQSPSSYNRSRSMKQKTLSKTRFQSKNSEGKISKEVVFSSDHSFEDQRAGSEELIPSSLSNRFKNNYKLQDFQILDLLGKGSYSQVFLARKIQTGDIYALKVVEISCINESTMDLFKRQQNIYKKLKSEFIVQFFYSFSDENLHFLVLEFGCGSSFQTLLDRQTYFEQKDARFYIASLILAVESIHKNNIIHRDLKPDNIIIDARGHLKLTDFNLAILKGHHSAEKKNQCFGTPDYLSPEVLSGIEQNHPTRDIWSIGIMIYQILVGVPPFLAETKQEVFQSIFQGVIEWPEIGSTQDGLMSPEAQSLIKALLNPDHTQRLGYNGWQEIKEHQFFKDFNWDKLSSYKPYYVPEEKQHYDVRDELYQRIKLKKKKMISSWQSGNLQDIIRFDQLGKKTREKGRKKVSKFRVEKKYKTAKQQKLQLPDEDKTEKWIGSMTSVDESVMDPPSTSDIPTTPLNQTSFECIQ